MTQVLSSEADHRNRLDTNKITWVLDSGCSDHIVNNDSFFYEYVLLKNPVDVKLRDGRIVKATKVGKINTSFEAYLKNRTLANTIIKKNSV